MPRVNDLRTDTVSCSLLRSGCREILPDLALLRGQLAQVGVERL